MRTQKEPFIRRNFFGTKDESDQKVDESDRASGQQMFLEAVAAHVAEETDGAAAGAAAARRRGAARSG